MTTQGNVKGLDVLGQEVLWSARGQQVMMQWEKRYMQLCVDALGVQPTDRVLEIGFGLAYSASHIQTFRPKSHTIIECDRETLQRAHQFAAAHSGVEIVAGTWQQQLHTLGQFDCVFFDDYPLPELEGGERGSCRRSRWHEFLDVALQHCAAGARISGYLARDVGLQRTGCEISITQVDVDAPEHCNYFPHKSALVPVITVVDPIAAGKGSAEVLPLQPLSFASKKFQRAFERTKQSEPARFARFPRERENISVIRDFLLAHEMDALTYEPSEGLQDGDEKSDVMNEDVNAADKSKQFAYPLDGMKHYNDAQSRREYLSTLRRKAAASKQMLG